MYTFAVPSASSKRKLVTGRSRKVSGSLSAPLLTISLSGLMDLYISSHTDCGAFSKSLYVSSFLSPTRASAPSLLQRPTYASYSSMFRPPASMSAASSSKLSTPSLSWSNFSKMRSHLARNSRGRTPLIFLCSAAGSASSRPSRPLLVKAQPRPSESRRYCWPFAASTTSATSKVSLGKTDSPVLAASRSGPSRRSRGMPFGSVIS
mmetsp:Transcript_30869/g.91649  ORF Transcript_30869/g.91649 Transcript_30869/m.91649 type:complete len:206 (+) Transcript_30869:328-945(+)